MKTRESKNGRDGVFADHASGRASVMERIEPGDEVLVLGQYGDYLYVKTPSGRTGWLSPD
jgi:hypothetical protein